MRRFHRRLGVAAALFVGLASVTGLLWAYAPYLYWEGNYLERKHPVVPMDFRGVTLTHQDAIRTAREQLGTAFVVSAVTLRSELGQPLFEVRGEERDFLIDARTGAPLSPLPADFAARVAAQYVRGHPPVAAVTLLDAFVHRSGKVYKPVYRVQFKAPKTPVIYLSARTGAIIEEEDDVRRFHFWVMRLHQLNFFGFRKTLTIIPGSAILLLVVSGFVLSRRARSRVARSER
jgi:uncharacterized iron-regulated membrane protein